MAEAAPYHPGQAACCSSLRPCRSHGKKLCVGRASSNRTHNNTKTQCILELNKACFDKSTTKGCTSVRCWRLRLSVLTLWSSCWCDDTCVVVGGPHAIVCFAQLLHVMQLSRISTVRCLLIVVYWRSLHIFEYAHCHMQSQSPQTSPHGHTNCMQACHCGLCQSPRPVA